jgi:hypothetical protein
MVSVFAGTMSSTLSSPITALQVCFCFHNPFFSNANGVYLCIRFSMNTIRGLLLVIGR